MSSSSEIKHKLILFQTRILVTHKLTVLPEVDHVIVLKDGKVLEQGKSREHLNQITPRLHISHIPITSRLDFYEKLIGSSQFDLCLHILGTYSDLMTHDSELHRIVSSYEPDKENLDDDKGK